MKKQNNNGMGTKVAVGISVLAGVAAAYLLLGKDGKKNRKAIKGWAIKMKGDIIEKFENAKDLTEDTYNNIIDEVSDRYSKIKDINKEELAEMVKDARKQWKMMTAGKPVRRAKSVVKKAVTKTKTQAKKSAPKKKSR